MDFSDEMNLTDLVEFDNILDAKRLTVFDFFKYLTPELETKTMSVDDWIEYLVRMSSVLSRSQDAIKAMITAFVRLNCGDYPDSVKKVVRNTGKVDMVMLSTLHPGLLEALAKEGKVSVSVANLKGKDADDCITYSESVYYTPVSE